VLDIEQLSKLLAQRLAVKCFTPLELTHFKDNFVTLADETDGLQFWKEDTLCQFLQIPDTLGVSHVLGQMLGYLGAWPFSSLAPAILTREALCKVVVIMTNRYEKVLKGGRRDRLKLLFRSLAVFDRRMSTIEKPEPEIEQHLHEGVEKDIREAVVESPSVASHARSFSVDHAGNDEEDDDEEELLLSALDSLDSAEIYLPEGLPTETHISQSQIPVDNFRCIILLLLLIAPLQPRDVLASLAERCSSQERLQEMQRQADSILGSFAPEHHSGISYSRFRSIIESSLPFFFEGLHQLFEHFMFSKNIDLSKRKYPVANPGSASQGGQVYFAATLDKSSDAPHLLALPILQQEGEILTSNLLSQISFFIPSEDLFYRLRRLYSGSTDGFSINAFEQKVLNWRAPTIVLISGTRINPSASHQSFPAKRFPPGSSGKSDNGRLVFGLYLNVPWKYTRKDAIGDAQSLLFQLEPIHDVFRASTLNRNYATLSKFGIAFGSPLPRDRPISGLPSTLILGPVSLNLDENFETGVFTHDSAGGGAYAISKAQRSDWEERFEVENMEVWGCGGDEVAKEQRERWKWEETEALARRGITLGRDKDADYALLEMAGLVGGHGDSGGSMG